MTLPSNSVSRPLRGAHSPKSHFLPLPPFEPLCPPRQRASSLSRPSVSVPSVCLCALSSRDAAASGRDRQPCASCAGGRLAFPLRPRGREEPELVPALGELARDRGARGAQATTRDPGACAGLRRLRGTEAPTRDPGARAVGRSSCALPAKPSSVIFAFVVFFFLPFPPAAWL